MISTVLIDIDDTLLDFNLCAKWAMNETAKRMCLQLPCHTYDCFREINASLWRQMERKEISSEGIYCVRWKKVSQAINLPFDCQLFEKHFLDYLSESAIAVEGAAETLDYLSSRYRVFVASNGPFDQQVRRMKLAKMDQFLSGYFVSEKIGYAKPTHEFFDVCYQQSFVANPDELIMIGDSLSADIKGARDYGIKTCWFDKNCSGSTSPADFQISRLLELKTIL